MKPGRGRKKKPLELINLHGNPGKRPIPEGIPQPEKLYDVPPAPEYLNNIAKEIWNKIAPELVRIGVLTKIDVYTLEQCCIGLSIARMAACKINEETLIYSSKGKVGRTPFLIVLRESLDLFQTYGANLGLSPADRMRLKEIKEPQKDNPLQEFIKHGKEISG